MLQLWWSLVSGTNKFDRGLSWLLHTELHWLDVPERVAYKLSIMMYSCMHGQAPQYLMDFSHTTSSVASRQQLRSASQWLLVISCCRLSIALWLVSRCGILCQTTCATVGPRYIWAIFEDVHISFVLAHTPHYRFHVYSLYKFTLTLTLAVALTWWCLM